MDQATTRTRKRWGRRWFALLLCAVLCLLVLFSIGAAHSQEPAWSFILRLVLAGTFLAGASRPSFARYLYARLGPGSPRQCLAHMFSRAFGASDFASFWRYWNPFLGYFLAYFCFAPLRRFAPRPLCLVVTFALNGFLFHDLVYLWPFGFARTARLPFPFPVFTLSLVTSAVIILAAERHQFTLARLSLPRRVACHLLAFFGPFAFSVGILLLTRL